MDILGIPVEVTEGGPDGVIGIFARDSDGETQAAALVETADGWRVAGPFRIRVSGFTVTVGAVDSKGPPRPGPRGSTERGGG